MAHRNKGSSSLATASPRDRLVVERVQTGVRIEKRLLKVLKAFAELRDMSLSDLLEGIVLHSFDNKTPFSAESLKRIESLKEIYGLDLDASASHQLHAKKAPRSSTGKENRSR